MPKVILSWDPDQTTVEVQRAPKDLNEETLDWGQVVVDIPSGLFNDYMRVLKRKEALDGRLRAIWKHAKQVGNGHRYG